MTDSPTIQLFPFAVKLEPQHSAVSVPEATSAGLFVGGAQKCGRTDPRHNPGNFPGFSSRARRVHEASADDRVWGVRSEQRPREQLADRAAAGNPLRQLGERMVNRRNGSRAEPRAAAGALPLACRLILRSVCVGVLTGHQGLFAACLGFGPQRQRVYTKKAPDVGRL